MGVAACGVEVPEDVADEIEAARETDRAPDTPDTTEAPTSDDDLEQALIDNGYTLEEARCGAENLRERLDDDEIEEVIAADTIEDIGFGVATEFADALRPCVEDGATDDEPDDDSDGDDSDDGPDGGGEATPGDRGGSEPDDGSGAGRGDADVPDFGDDSTGDVSRSRFLAGLISAGIPAEIAACLVDGIYATFEQEDINVLFHADDRSEVPADVLAAFDEIAQDCDL